MMKRIMSAFAFILMAVILVAPFTASAQVPDKETVGGAGIQIQNIGESQAQVTVEFIGPDRDNNGAGDVIATRQITGIPSRGSVTLLSTITDDIGTSILAFPSGTQGFDGSVVISSDQPILAITNLLAAREGNTFGATEGYPGFPAGSREVSVPLVTRNNDLGGGNRGASSISIQNVGPAATTVDINYSNGTSENRTIPQNGSVTIFNADTTALGDGLFVGSAKIRAREDAGRIVAAVQLEGGRQLGSYAAFTDNATTVAIPLVVANNEAVMGYTGLQIQNAGTAAADITITFSPNQQKEFPNPNNNGTLTDEVCGAGSDRTMVARTFTNVPAGESRTLISFDFATSEDPDPSAGAFDGTQPLVFDKQFRGCLYIGSAIVTSSQPLVATVNQTRQLATRSTSTYEGFRAATGNTQASSRTELPLITAGNFGQLTGVQVQNVGTGSTFVRISYGSNGAEAAAPGNTICTENPAPRTVEIARNGSFTFVQNGLPVADFGEGLQRIGDTGFDSQFLRCTYIGSATIETVDANGTPTSGQIVAIANQVGVGAADTLTTYNGFNQ